MARVSCARIPETVLVFDVGGTRLRCARYQAESDKLLGLERRETPSIHSRPGASQEAIRNELYATMDSMRRRALLGERPAWVSVAFPGPVDPRGNALAAPTVWGDASRAPVSLLDDLARLWPEASVLVLNDISAAGFRFRTHPHESFCILTVSSGIGVKVFVDGQPITGPHGRGGELGHLCVDFSGDAPKCDCGLLGHLGAVASGRASAEHIARLAREDPEAFAASPLGSVSGGDPSRVTNPMLARAFSRGDVWARRVVDRIAQPLGRLLSSIHLLVGTERFVIVGGFALALGEPYRQMLARTASESGWSLGVDWDELVELGVNDDDAGLIGAGRYALDVARQSP